MTFLANGVYVYFCKQTISILMLGVSKGRFCLSELFSFYKANVVLLQNTIAVEWICSLLLFNLLL